MKLAICTINDYENYGNRLQNYALQEVLSSLGHDVSTIKNFQDSSSSRLKRYLKHSGLYMVIRKAKLRIKSKDEYNRLVNFLNFTKKYIKEDPTPVTVENDKNANFGDYHAFIIGSDQTWNCNFSRFSSLDFAPYAKKNQQVISYSASFGVYEVPEECIPIYEKGLESLDYISVREKAGKELVKKLSNREAEVVLDPTLLLSTEQWKQIADTSKIKIQKKYILTYFLGNLKDEDEIYIEKYAQNHGFSIVQLGKRGNAYWAAGPEDFVKLFQGSEAVFTDSYHGCIFSIIFEKYFEAFHRISKTPSMNSRLETLFADLNLEDRWHDSLHMDSKLDYENVCKQITQRKTSSMSFLTNSLADVEL